MSEQALQEREEAILLEIIQYYLSHHNAISARTLSKISRLSLSPTTIRNLMEDLSSNGLLTNEGVTRGRIPTQKAFTVYVTQLRQHERPPGQARETPIQALEEGEEANLERWLDQVGETLHQETGMVALAALTARDAYPLHWVHFAELPGQQVLVNVKTQFGDLWSKVLQATDPFPEALLREVTRYINETFRGRSLASIRNEVMQGDSQGLLAGMPSLGAAVRMLRRGFEWGEAPSSRVWGRDAVLSIPEFQHPQSLARIYRVLADEALLQTVRGQAHAVEGGWVSLGTETGTPGLEQAAVVGFPFGAGHWRGQLALLGPMRMNYSLVLSLLSRAAALLSTHMTSLVTR